jgi:hypothetical protein
VIAVLRHWSLRAEHPSLGAIRLDGGRAASHGDSPGLLLTADRLAGSGRQNPGIPGNLWTGQSDNAPKAYPVEQGWVNSSMISRCSLTLGKSKAATGPPVLEGGASLGRVLLLSQSLSWPATIPTMDERGISRTDAKSAGERGKPVFDCTGAKLRRAWVAEVQDLSSELRSDGARLLEALVERAAVSVHQDHSAADNDMHGFAAMGEDSERHQNDAASGDGAGGVDSGARIGAVRYRHVVLRVSGDTVPALSRVARRAAALFEQPVSGGSWPASSSRGRGDDSSLGDPLDMKRGPMAVLGRTRSAGFKSPWWSGNGNGTELESETDSSGLGSEGETGGDAEGDEEESGDGEALRGPGVFFSSRSPQRRRNERAHRRRRARWDAEGEADGECGAAPAGEIRVAGEVRVRTIYLFSCVLVLMTSNG